MQWIFELLNFIIYENYTFDFLFSSLSALDSELFKVEIIFAKLFLSQEAENVE